VKVLTSTYQAEYGRSSGLQITATTKSGSNRFRGSVYDVERNSKWNANSHQLPERRSEGQDRRARLGLSRSAAPVGKLRRGNKLFFFYSQEFAPRTSGNDRQVFRVPTEAERRGDFSATTDNLSNPFPTSRIR
jgi:hypothetical protein